MGDHLLSVLPERVQAIVPSGKRIAVVTPQGFRFYMDENGELHENNVEGDYLVEVEKLPKVSIDGEGS